MSRAPIAQVSRLLTLVPLISANQGRLKTEVAQDLGISVKQLEKDLSTLWMCGRPGLGGGDLIDLAFGGDTVEVTDSQGIDRPLRLTRAEASALLLALGFLVEQQSSVAPSAARSAMVKIEAAAQAPDRGAQRDGRGGGSGAGAADDGTAAEADDVQEPAAAAAVRDAVHRRRALRIRYYSATRDARTERVVDPIRIQLVSGNSYLQAWCRDAHGVRMFRFDRIDEAHVLDEPSTPDTDGQDDALADFYDASAGLPQVRLAVAPECLWALDYFPMVTEADHPDGGVEVSLRYASDAWLRRLILGFGGRIRILDRPGIAEQVHAGAAAALDAYARSADFPLETIR